MCIRDRVRSPPYCCALHTGFAQACFLRSILYLQETQDHRQQQQYDDDDYSAHASQCMDDIIIENDEEEDEEEENDVSEEGFEVNLDELFGE